MILEIELETGFSTSHYIVANTGLSYSIPNHLQWDIVFGFPVYSGFSTELNFGFTTTSGS
jgi:hypothetical protein